MAEEGRFFPETRSLSLSELFEDGVCVGVLPGDMMEKTLDNRSFTPFRRRLNTQAGVTPVGGDDLPAEGVRESIRPDDCEEVSSAGHSIRAS